MKIIAAAVISLAFLCLQPFALGKVDRYKMALVEKGTPFSEQIDVDEGQDAEVFRVPRHNDFEGADFYHDFKMRLTATRIPSRKVCYISELDPSLSSPTKLKADLNRVSSQPGQLPVTTKSHLVVVTGPANRILLTKEILDFCGALPIYNIELMRGDPSDGNGTAKFQVQRQKRQDVVNFVSCGNFGAVVRCPGAKWNLLCKMKSGTCYYYVTCINQQPDRALWKCTNNHITNSFPSCCDYSCP